MLRIFVEENAFGAVRAVEVAPDMPVAVLTSRLVEELHLPKTDLFGKKLFYRLRQVPDGQILPEEVSLRASGIQAEATLSLLSYGQENAVPVLVSRAFAESGEPIDLNFHGSPTLADRNALPVVADQVLPEVMPAQRQRGSRRAFLLLSGALLGIGASGVSYAAYQLWRGGLTQALLGGTLKGTMTMQNVAPAQSPVPKNTPVPLPTIATPVFTFQQHTQTVRSLAWSGTGNLLVSGADDQRILVWQPDGAVVQTFRPGDSVRALAWAPDGQRLAAGAGNAVLFYNVQTGKRLARVRKHTQMVTSLAWSGHGQTQVVSGAEDMRAVVWDTVKYQPRFTFMQHTSAIDSVTWAVNGDTIASASQGGVIRVWSGNTGLEVHGYYFDGAVAMRAVAFAPTGMQLAAGGGDGSIRIWNGVECQQQAAGQFGMQCVDQPQHLQTNNSAIRALSWSPDGRFLLSGSDDGSIVLWSPGQRQTPVLMVKQNTAARSLSWSPDGKMFASADGTNVRLWKLA
ncbi:MAG TPA: WD40 repeat domain-containing protein [Ktedonobacteraceae bacterium]|nr:WD40 repeat domain-containing protein [Ktedonobacteraceae bacterium]